MKRTRSITRNKSTIIGLMCGIGCALCVGLYVFQVDQQAAAAQSEILAKYGGDQIEVCVARRDLTAGETISEGDIDVKKWVTSLLPAHAVLSKADAVGKQLGSTVLAGEVISSSRFGFDAERIEVPAGLSAISVPAQEVQAVGGALSPGMHTDVYAVGANATTKLVSDVLVLATSSSEDTLSKSSTAWITLALAPAKVEEMVAAAENLQLYFVLPSETKDAGKKDAGSVQHKAETNETVAPDTNTTHARNE